MNDHKLNWAKMAALPSFCELHSRKKVFLLTWWCIGSLGFYALPVSAGYFPEFMGIKLIGRLNVGYFFCLAEFAMIWVIALYYTRKTNRYFDPLTKQVVAEIEQEAKK